jgi:hypothetical protein
MRSLWLHFINQESEWGTCYPRQVGLYLENERFLQASKTRGGVVFKMERSSEGTENDSKDGGTPLEKDAIVAGTTEYAVLFEQFGVGLRDNLKRFESELNDFIESFRRLSESEQIKRLEKGKDV